MVMVYTFVFTVVFPTRWGAAEIVETNFVVIYLVGALIHGLFAEAMGRAPNLIVGQANYVKKVVFPLEILPIVVVAGALDYGDDRLRDCGAAEPCSGSHGSVDRDLPAGDPDTVSGAAVGDGPLDQRIGRLSPRPRPGDGRHHHADAFF